MSLHKPLGAVLKLRDRFIVLEAGKSALASLSGARCFSAGPYTQYGRCKVIETHDDRPPVPGLSGIATTSGECALT
jgi:hypothetical protein